MDKILCFDNNNSITFTIKDTKLYIPFLTLSARDNQNLSKFFSNEFERSLYWNEYKIEVRMKIRQINIDTLRI